MLIKQTIEALKQIQEKVYIGEGCFDEFVFEFNPPATLDEIRMFEFENSLIVPEDYLNFLLASNGMQFYEAGDFTFRGIREISEMLKFMKESGVGYKDGIYPIAYILEDYIVIKSDEIPSGKYMYAGSCCCVDEYFSLGCNFETFFDQYIIANACNYWRWQPHSEKFNFSE